MKIHFFLILFFIIIILNSCNEKQNSESDIAKIIDENINIIINPKNSEISESSNPQEYIDENIKAYNKIIELGEPALKYMIVQLGNSKDNGLEYVIMVHACCDILGDKNPIKKWHSPNNWYLKYIETKK